MKQPAQTIMRRCVSLVLVLCYTLTAHSQQVCMRAGGSGYAFGALWWQTKAQIVCSMQLRGAPDTHAEAAPAAAKTYSRGAAGAAVLRG